MSLLIRVINDTIKADKKWGKLKKKRTTIYNIRLTLDSIILLILYFLAPDFILIIDARDLIISF